MEWLSVTNVPGLLISKPMKSRKLRTQAVASELPQPEARRGSVSKMTRTTDSFKNSFHVPCSVFHLFVVFSRFTIYDSRFTIHDSRFTIFTIFRVLRFSMLGYKRQHLQTSRHAHVARRTPQSRVTRSTRGDSEMPRSSELAGCFGCRKSFLRKYHVRRCYKSRRGLFRSIERPQIDVGVEKKWLSMHLDVLVGSRRGSL